MGKTIWIQISTNRLKRPDFTAKKLNLYFCEGSLPESIPYFKLNLGVSVNSFINPYSTFALQQHSLVTNVRWKSAIMAKSVERLGDNRYFKQSIRISPRGAIEVALLTYKNVNEPLFLNGPTLGFSLISWPSKTMRA